MYPPFDLSGQGAVITGGNGGIGLGMARALLASGAKVAIWGSNAQKTERAREQLAGECGDATRISSFVCDVGDEAQVDSAFAASVAALGRVDACFANAGVSGRGLKSFLDMTTEGNDVLIGARQNPASAPFRINWRSSDLGQSWTPVYPQIFLLESILQSYDTPAGKRILTNQGSYAVSQNDQLWETRSFGLPGGPASQIVRTGPGSWVAGDQFKLYVTENDGQSWRLSWYDELAFPDGLFVVGNAVLARVSQPGLLRSDDGGQSWYPDIPPISATPQAYCPLGDSSVLAVLPPGELYRYDVPAKTWQWLATIGDIQKLAVLNSVIFTEGSNCIRASVDMGKSFVELRNGLPMTFNCYRLFSIGERLFASDFNNSGLYVSNNLGLSWELSPGPASDLYLPLINRMAGDGDVLLAANSSRVYVTDGGGDQWFASDVPVQSFGLVEVSFLGSFENSVYLCFYHNQRTYFLRREIADLAFEKLTGRVYEDTNNNQAPDPGEPGIPNALVYTLHGQHYALTDSTGRYTLPFTPPQDSVAANPPFLIFTSSPSGYSVSQARDSLDFAIFTDLQDFRMLLETNSLPRPGFEVRITLQLLNAGLNPEDAQVRALVDPRLQILETIPPATQSGDTLTWATTAVPAYIPQTFQIDAVLGNTAQLGSVLEAHAWVEMLSDTDDFPGNNADTLRQTIVGSYDPNDKTARSGDLVLKTAVEAGTRLEYTIRFQNTGNFPAEFVRILDTLESDFDPLTFALEGASHPVRVRYAQPRVLDFFFDHIQLPDSASDETGSHGFVRYSIAPYRNLVTGDSLENRAAIYFDYNPPVITNTAFTVVSGGLGTAQVGEEISFRIRPNPVAIGEKATLVLPAPASSPVRLQLFDMDGKAVKEWQAPAGAGQILLPGLTAGMYSLQLQTGNRKGVRLLVVK